MKYLAVALCVFANLCLQCCSEKQLPSFIKKCKRGTAHDMEACIKERIEDLRPRLVKGIPEMKITAIEPLHVDKLNIRTGYGRAVLLNADVTDLLAYGVKDFKISTFKFDLEKLKFTLGVQLPKLQVEGSYTALGKILLFEIRSSGKMGLNLTDIDASCTSQLTIVPKNGKEYVRIETGEKDYVLDYKYDKVSIRLGNVVRRNPRLTEEINKAINGNIYELAAELNPLIFKSVHLLIVNLIKPVFDEFSLDELFES